MGVSSGYTVASCWQVEAYTALMSLICFVVFLFLYEDNHSNSGQPKGACNTIVRMN